MMSSNACVLSKETFCKALRMIKEQESIYDEVSEVLRKVSDGYVPLGSNNKWLEALRMVLKETVNDQYGYIEWWLYEAADDFKVWEADGGKEWCLREPEALYDYIVTECQR